MPKSNYPNGFKNGVTIRNVPILNTYGGSVFWVDSNNGGSDGNPGTVDSPFSTIDYAVGRCSADKGDIIIVKPGHSETISSASAITVDVAGINIVGLGSGQDRPRLTFGSATTASVVISAASCSFLNFIGIAAIDGLTSPFNVTGDNCTLDIEWQDGSSTVEAATAVRLDTANGANLNLVYKGFTAGNAVVSAVRIDDCDNVNIAIHAYGVNSTSWVEMVDVASTNVYVKGYMYTSGVTNGSRNVVDTITGSTWFAEIEDGSAGAKFSGGSAAALASDDVSGVSTQVSTLQAEISGAAGISSFPAAAAPANNVSLAEVVRDIWDVNRNGTGGAEPETNRSIMDYQGVSPTFFMPGIGYRVASTTPTDIFDGTSNKTIFTVSGGKVLLKCIWIESSGAAMANSASNLTFSTNPTVGTDLALSSNLDIDSDEVGSIYSFSTVGSATTGGSGGGAPTLNAPVIIDVGTICINTSADVGTGGALGVGVMYYLPLEAGATVSAAF